MCKIKEKFRKICFDSLHPRKSQLKWKQNREASLFDSHPSVVDCAGGLHGSGVCGWRRRISHHRQGRRHRLIASVDVRVRLISYLLDGRCCCCGRWDDFIFLDIVVVCDFLDNRLDAWRWRNRFLKTEESSEICWACCACQSARDIYLFFVDDGFVQRQIWTRRLILLLWWHNFFCI